MVFLVVVVGAILTEYVFGLGWWQGLMRERVDDEELTKGCVSSVFCASCGCLGLWKRCVGVWQRSTHL